MTVLQEFVTMDTPFGICVNCGKPFLQCGEQGRIVLVVSGGLFKVTANRFP